MDNFKTEIAELLEVDNVELNEVLESFDCWDSLTILSIIAMAGENYNVTLSAAEINKSRTVGELEELIKSKISKSV
jgi:acyl carrier protein